MKVHWMGDAALLVDTPTWQAAQALRNQLLAEHIDGITDIVPGLDSLLIRANPLQTDMQTLATRLKHHQADTPTHIPPKRIDIPVQYNGPDLAEVARLTGLSEAAVIQRHEQARYRVAFLGFAPGFPYLVGLNDALRVPRMATPRTKVPAGSVAIADAMTAIYPHATPGGWRLIGQTDAPLFNPDNHPPALLAPGDEVRFVRQP